MTLKRSTRSAILLSILSLVLCFTMLLGTTFAWFTDTATTGVNKIQAGTLKIDLYHEVDEETAGKLGLVADAAMEGWYSIKDNPTHAIWDYDLWEPGYTNYESVKIVNEGTLALKYVLQVTMEDAVVNEETGADLAEVIDVYVMEGSVDPENFATVKETWQYAGTLKDLFTDPDGVARGVLLPKGGTAAEGEAVEAVTMTVALHMQEEAGNEYQGLSLGDLYVSLFATQYTYEDDSFDDQYDKDAYLPIVKTAGELKSALENGESVQLANDITLDAAIDLPAGVNVTLNLAGNALTAETDNGYAIYNSEGGKLVIDDTSNGGVVTGVVYTGTDSETIINGGTFNAVDGGTYVLLNSEGSLTINDATINSGSSYPVYSYGANNDLTINDADINATFGCINAYGLNSVVTINGGTFTMTGVQGNTSHIAYFSNGDVTINGGTFEQVGDIDMSGDGGGGVCVIYGASLTVNGGTFSGDYADIYDWGGTNANGRANIITIKGGTYKFAPTAKYIAEGHVVIGNADGTYTVSRDYQEVVAAGDNKAENGAVLGDTLSNLTDDKDSFISLGEGEYKMPSVNGNKDFTIVGTKDTVIDVTLGAYMDSSTVAFEGVTIKGSTGYANGNGSDYAALYTPNVTYTNCTFDGPFRIGRDGATFINCKFTNLGNDYVWTYGNDATFKGCTFESDGKALLIYSDGGDEVSQVVVEDCVFNATQGAKAGAIANQNCAAIEIQNYGNGVNLVTSGNTIDSDFSGEWRIKTYHANNPAVIVNGTEYTSIALDGKTMTIDAGNNVTVVD